jgi:thiamine biosynthesis protein ThiI
MPMFRPLAGDDKQEILALARRIGTYEISAEPFHDCCPIFLPRSPELYATPAELEKAEEGLNVPELVRDTVRSAAMERFTFHRGKVERVEDPAAEPATVAKQRAVGQSCSS